ncbi:MAG TPA: tetratricopeptide repeat protein [Candidatus Tectomicrobia bacterium]
MLMVYRRVLFLCAMLSLVSCSSKPKGTALASLPLTLEQTYQEGRAAYEAGKFDEAAEKFARVANADPQYLNALINWGSALSLSGKPMQAIAKYQQALTQDPNKAEAYYNWGVALERLGRHQEAVAKYEQALVLRADLMTPALRRYLERQRPRLQDDTRVGPSLPRVTPSR